MFKEGPGFKSKERFLQELKWFNAQPPAKASIAKKHYLNNADLAVLDKSYAKLKKYLDYLDKELKNDRKWTAFRKNRRKTLEAANSMWDIVQNAEWHKRKPTWTIDKRLNYKGRPVNEPPSTI